jgi:L,D-peptidoglycan transpeptidase YkuD (ErfK/YbiS/YcfS/YnhG family)
MWWPRFRLSAISAVLILSGVAAGPAHAADQVEQMVYVTAPTTSATQGWVRTYERRGKGPWKAVTPAVRAWFGYGGLVAGDQRRQGTGTTPIGRYAFVSGFGRLADPGTKLRYKQFDRNDAWTYNPAYPRTYNVFQTANRDWRNYGKFVERLWSYGRQYSYVAVLDYNLPTGPITRGADGVRRSTVPPNTQRGGGIFLHVDNGKPTAGCIGIPMKAMRDIMRWIDPKKDPHIVIAVRKDPLAHPNI